MALPAQYPTTGGFEYPDIAGYPDGMGTLHQGTADYERRPDLAPFDMFMEGDARGA